MQAKVPMKKCIEAVNKFQGVKRRMEFVGNKGNISLFDDFAHHPTEIESSIKSLKIKYKNKKILSICEIKSNSMISGAHKSNLPSALAYSHHSIIVKSPLSKWSLKGSNKKLNLVSSYENVIDYIHKYKNQIDIILIMSNKSTIKLRNAIIDEKK